MNAGVDEAGKGCIFGPVYAAAVIWDPAIDHPYLKDSKKLTKKQRVFMYDFVLENAIDYGIGYSTNECIDNINIHKANMKAMHKAIDNLSLDIDHLYIDGNIFDTYKCISHSCIVGGDALYKNIMAASILAKVSHDKHIETLINEYPSLDKYHLCSNMGYATAQHIKAVETYGRSEFHRHSFKLPFEKHKFNFF